MARIYFDITDIISYARSHTRVSGIQRVQWNIIAHLARKYGEQLVRCSFHDRRSKSMWECNPAEAMVGDEFDAELMLIRLGLLKYRRSLPSKPRVKEYLRRYSHNKLLRTLRKIDVHLSSYLYPRRLARMGLERMNRLAHQLKRAALRPLPALGPEESYVLLGTPWGSPQVLDFARKHKQAGGDVVQLMYDLIPYKFPQFASSGMAETFTRWLVLTPGYATRFMCISVSTANDLRQFLRGCEGQWDIAAIPLAHEFLGFDRFARVPPPSSRIAAVAQRPYVLCVGTIEIRKNGAALLRAWQRLRQNLGADLPRLVFAGCKGWLTEDFTEALDADPAVAEVIDLPTDEDLAFLYQNCLFTAYPSYYEGWGLPVGESAWFGKYCVAANTSSLPEVCGDLIDYVDPEDPDDIALKLQKPLTNPEYVRTRELGIAAQPMRRWTDVADDMLRFITRLGPADLPAKVADPDRKTTEYIKWKDWRQERFAQPNARESRYYRWHVRRALPKIENPTVLEIGFGNGTFLGFCQQQGWPVVGTERAQPLLERARAAGYAVAGDMEQLPPKASFDLIVLFDVLEHIPAEDVVSFVKSLTTRLNRSGALLIRVPNGDSPFGRHYQHGDFTHVTTFGRSKFEQLAGLCNLRVAAVGEAPWYAQQMEDRTIQSVRRALVRALFNRLFGFAFYGHKVDLAPNMVVVMKHLERS